MQQFIFTGNLTMANNFGRREIPVDSGTPDLVQESIV